MKNTQLLVALSEQEGFMTLTKGFASYYPILGLNLPKYDNKRSQFLALKSSFKTEFNDKHDVSLWDKTSNDNQCSFEYFGARLEKVIDEVYKNATEFVRQIDVPLLLLDEVKDDKLVVYSTNRGVNAIDDFFNTHPGFNKDDLFIVIV